MKNKILIFIIIILSSFSSDICAQNNMPDDKIDMSGKKIKYYHVEEVISQRFGGNKRVYNVTYENLISTTDLGPYGKRTVTPVFEEEKEQQRQLVRNIKKDRTTITPIIKQKGERQQQLAKTIKSHNKTLVPILEEEKEERQQQVITTIKTHIKATTPVFEKEENEQQKQVATTNKNPTKTIPLIFGKEEDKQQHQVTTTTKNLRKTIASIFEKEEDKQQYQVAETTKNSAKTTTVFEKEKNEQQKQLVTTNKSEKRTASPVLNLEKEQKQQVEKFIKNIRNIIVSLFKAREEQERKLAKTINNLEPSEKVTLNTLSEKVKLDNLNATLNDLSKIEKTNTLPSPETSKEVSTASYTINVIEIYERVVENGYESIEILTQVGDSYYFKNDFNNAQKYYEKLFKKFDKAVEPEYYYRYSVALRSKNEINTADQYLKKYNQLQYSNFKN